MSPKKILASVGPSMTRSPGLTPSRLTTGTMPPITIGNWASPAFVEFLARKRRIARAERYGLCLDLLDAAARADRLIVQPVAGFLFVRIRPFGVDRIGERSASAGNVGGVGRNERGGGDEAGGCQCGPVFHGFSPCLRPKTRTDQKDPSPLSLCPIARAAAVALKDALHDDLGRFWFVTGWSEVAVSHRRRMSPFYKASVTLR